MRFLFDQSADFRLIPYLQDLGHDVQVISRDYPPGLPDDEVLAIARREHRVLLVADRDFGHLVFQQHRSHAGVIFVRLPGAPLSVKIDRLNHVLSAHAADLRRGEFLVVTPTQVRVARQPAQG
jgi:predicted nuclease of predicted toxin-antitoxin system